MKITAEETGVCFWSSLVPCEHLRVILSGDRRFLNHNHLKLQTHHSMTQNSLSSWPSVITQIWPTSSRHSLPPQTPTCAIAVLTFSLYKSTFLRSIQAKFFDDGPASRSFTCHPTGRLSSYFTSSHLRTTAQWNSWETSLIHQVFVSKR